ncbi:M3 family oligoendopeptidase [Scopulibacillus darangshiensis]|uniref:M3 family oligoendopeptidase n=1 Tax=Scopulibacillus darangshiensis TaxID=442528 RepID=UPI001FB3B0FE|nr:M3 family oligoendopeptidase [Scopulibacillus darangshiensis]
MKTFYTEKLDFRNSEVIEKEFKILLDAKIDSAEELENWLRQQSKLYDALQEGLNGHYIQFQCQSDSENAKAAYEHDQQSIQPLFKKYKALLDEKFYQSPYRLELDQSYYGLLNQRIKNAMDLFRQENIALEIKEDRLSTNYFEHTGSLTVEWEGKEKPLSQIYPYLQDSDRSIRQKAMTAIFEKMETKSDQLQTILSELIQIRQKKAENAGLANFRDYMFKKYERFDYTPEDCKELAESVRKYVVPLKEEIERKQKERLNVDTYRPWDMRGVPADKKPLKPFENVDRLITGVAAIFGNLDPRFAGLLGAMNDKGMLDLESRKGKAPGGFCESLPLSGHSFIFMNAAGTQYDVATLLHEMGHCIHDYLKKDIIPSQYKDIPMESAELASMSMELMTMDRWDEFYSNPEELIQAKKDQLEDIIRFLPHGVIIDQFQHWLYEHPEHTATERSQKYKELTERFDSSFTDWSGYEDWMANHWQAVLHIFEVPFYYIEYVIAQLGAVQMYKQYKENPEQAVENYKKALSLGSTKSLTEVYEAAGIRFDFSGDTIKELMAFVAQELDELEN